MTGKTSASELNNTFDSDDKLKLDADTSKNSFNKNKRRVIFNSFTSKSNPLYKKEEKSSTLFRNYFDDSYEKFVTEEDDEVRTEDTITLKKSPIKINNTDENSLTLNISKDKLLFNNIQYDSMFIRTIDPFKESTNKKILSHNGLGFTGNILDELKEENGKNEEDDREDSEINTNYFNEKPPNYYISPKKESIKFEEDQQLNEKNNIKSKNRLKKGQKGRKNGNDTTRELLKNKFLKFVKKYASINNNNNNIDSISNDVEIEKSFYNFYDENFGKNGIDFDASICTYERNDGSKYNITVNDLFDNRTELDEFKNGIYIDNHENDEVIIKPRTSSKSHPKKLNSSFQYNYSFVYDHGSFGPGYEDNLNYVCYNISTCIGDDFIINEEEENKKKNENILSRLYEEEEEEKKKTTETKLNSLPVIKGKEPENSKLKENLKTLMESEAFKNVIKDPDTLTLFLKGVLIGYVDPKKIDQTKDKFFKIIDNKEIEQIKKFVSDYIEILEESEDKIKDMKEKSIMIETEKTNSNDDAKANTCTDVIESNPGFIARFNEIMIEKFTNINNAIINFTSSLCPQIIKDGFSNIIKSIPFVVSFVSLIPMEYVTAFLSSFPAGQAVLTAINDIIMKSTFLASSHLVLPQIAIIIGCIYKYFTTRNTTSGNDENSGEANDNNHTDTFLSKFMEIFEMFSNNLRSDGGISNTEKDPSIITSKVVNAAFKALMESKDFPSLFSNEKMNAILTNIMSNLPNSENKIKVCLAVFNEVMNKDNIACKTLFEELINLLDREKLSDEDFSKILSLIIKESRNLGIASIEDQKKDEKAVATSSNLIKDDTINDDESDNAIFDKSYSVIMLSHVVDEIKRSKGELDSDNKIESDQSRSIPKGKDEKIIHEYRMNRNESISDKHIKMKRGYGKRSFSSGDENKRLFLGGSDNQFEFVIKKNGPRNINAQFSIRRNDNNGMVEQLIPKYYTSPSSAPSTSPIVLERGYNSNDERISKYPLTNKYNEKDSTYLYHGMNKGDNVHSLNMTNEWNNEISKNSSSKNQQENFILETKGLNLGDGIMNDETFTTYISDNEQLKQNNNILEPFHSNEKYSSYSINYDDTYDRLFLANDISTTTTTSTSNESFNKSKISDKSKKTKTSFKQKIMKHFSRSVSKKNKVPKYIEWENLPLEIVFNIFNYFSTEERAQLREVSKYFNYVLTNPVFFMNINLTAESDTADNTLLLYQWKLSNGYLLSLNLSQCTLISDDVFKDVIDYKIQDRKINDKSVNERANLCYNDTHAKFEKEESLVQNIRHLDLSYCSGLYSSQTMSNFFKGISIQSDGTIIKKNGCINLEELNLSDLYQILDDDLLISIADSCPKLKILYISKGYDITNYSVKVILRKCKHLTTLKIANCPKINYEAFDTRCIEEISITSDNTIFDLNLRSLNVSYCRMMEDNLIKMVSDNCPYLEELYISGCQNISNEGMKYLVSGRAWKNKRIKVLDISGCYCIGDDGIKTLTPAVLEKLDISDCSFITDFGLKYIFEGMPFLKEIGYENCSGTSSIGRDKLQSKYEILSKTE